MPRFEAKQRLQAREKVPVDPEKIALRQKLAQQRAEMQRLEKIQFAKLQNLRFKAVIEWQERARSERTAALKTALESRMAQVSCSFCSHSSEWYIAFPQCEQ